MTRHELFDMADALAAFFYAEGNFYAAKFFGGMAEELKRATRAEIEEAYTGIVTSLERGRNKLGPAGLA